MNGKNDQPSDDGYRAAAWLLNCDEPAIRAVAEVESGPAGAFFDDGSPVILYEPHIFSRLTRGKFDISNPDLSYPAWKPGAYGKASDQHPKLQRAVKLDREAALMACSWGTYQILGENHRRAGHSTVQRMVTAAYRSADDHLRMFVQFILADPRLTEALQTHWWEDFARIYNGPGFKVNKYDSKMAAAHKRLTTKEK